MAPLRGCQQGRAVIVDKCSKFVQSMCQSVCQLCGGDGLSPDICGGCLRDLPRARAVCPRCAASVPGAVLCGECQRRPPAFDSALAAFRYAFPVDRLLQRLKYEGRLEHGRMLGLLLGRAVRHHPLPEALIPVPLHVTRWRERGFNQALEIARPVARMTGVRLDTRSCRRLRATPPLWSLEPASRRRLLGGAFTVTGDVTGLHVALVDDVLTSGATAGALASELKRAGAARVDVWTVARAEGRLGRRPQAPAKP